MRLAKYGLLALAASMQLACAGPAPTADLPTAHIVRAAAQPATPQTAARTSTPTPTDPPTPTAIPTSLPTAQSLGTPLDQYRAWMEEARARHPYSESLDVMWQVMLCESSGKAEQVSGPYYGLFQYQLNTWSGEWNPYRDSPILDARAQIFATAKAWQDGNQHWWGCYTQ